MSLDSFDTLLSPEAIGDSPMVQLFGGPVVVLPCGRRLVVPEGSKRLLVLVALRRGRVERRYAAGTLWPIGDDDRAAGNLRSALWRLNRAGIHVLDANKHSLALCPDVVVDLHVINAWAARLISGRPGVADLAVIPNNPHELDLLPGCYDDWVLLERERMRQRLLHGLEALSRYLREAGRYAQAVESAMLAVNAEPLRESAQRELLEAHLAEGNWEEGRRGYEAYRELVRRELGVSPGPELTALL